MAQVGLDAAGPFRRDQPGAARSARRRRCPTPTWHDDVATLPDDRPLIVVANEFFDALPIRQLVRAGDALARAAGRLPGHRCSCRSPARTCPTAIIPRASARRRARIDHRDLARLRRASRARSRSAWRAQGGAALVIDYGYEGPAIGDTLQAVSGHQFANPFEEPGEPRPHRACRFRDAGRRGGGRGRARRRPGRPGRLPDRARYRAARRGARRAPRPIAPTRSPPTARG